MCHPLVQLFSLLQPLPAFIVLPLGVHVLLLSDLIFRNAMAQTRAQPLHVTLGLSIIRFPLFATLLQGDERAPETNAFSQACFSMEVDTA